MKSCGFGVPGKRVFLYEQAVKGDDGGRILSQSWRTVGEKRTGPSDSSL